MAFPTYTLADLSEVTGRSAISYTNLSFVGQAIKQSTLLFLIGTNRSDAPTFGAELELMKLGILHMADAIYLSQPFAEELATPFQSENIGSYSYTKMAGAVMHGLPTGVSWFDLAVQRLALGRPTDFITGGIEVFENQNRYRNGHIGQNQRVILPHDVDAFYDWTGAPVHAHNIYTVPSLLGGDALETGTAPQVAGALAQADFTIVQGADTQVTFRYLAGDPATPIDLSGYTARAQFRAGYGGGLWLTLATGAGLTLDASGYITITIPHAITETPDWDGRSSGVWDLELTDGNGAVERFLEGTVVVSHDVTR